MKQYSKLIVGMDVHKNTTTVAVISKESEQVIEHITIETVPKAIEKLAKRLAQKGDVEFVYEAGPCGYEVQRQIEQMGYPCVVIAPGLIPVRPGDRVKTDRRDAEKLARLYRAGELTAVGVPSRQQEAARDLVRSREDTLGDRLRSRHRLSKFLLRQGRIFSGKKAWSSAYIEWLRTQKFEYPALEQTFESYLRASDETEARMRTLEQQLSDLAETEVYRVCIQYLRCLKGVDTLTALTLLVETQDFKRFKTARDFMGYTGLVSSEYSSGSRIQRGSITKAGNAHLRRVLVESAWTYHHRNVSSKILNQRRQGCPGHVVAIARKAQDRLHRKFWRMVQKSKPHSVSVVAVARELAGFVWSISQHFPTSLAS